jgi:hypothetical protein
MRILAPINITLGFALGNGEDFANVVEIRNSQAA